MMGTPKGKQGNEGFELVITTAPIPDLNEKLIVFGRIIKGKDVVQVIIYQNTMSFIIWSLLFLIIFLILIFKKLLHMRSWNWTL